MPYRDPDPGKYYTLPETNRAPEDRPSQKETIVFQPSIFRWELLVAGRVLPHFRHEVGFKKISTNLETNPRFLSQTLNIYHTYKSCDTIYIYIPRILSQMLGKYLPSHGIFIALRRRLSVNPQHVKKRSRPPKNLPKTQSRFGKNMKTSGKLR